MSEFVGRTGSLRVYSYPEPRRAGASADPLARNFATAKEGPLGSVENDVAWVADVPADPVNTTEVPITPLSTGSIEISGFMVISNTNEDTNHPIEILISVDGSSVPATMTSEAIVPFDGMLSIPFTAQVNGLTVGDTVPVTMVLVTVGDSGMSIESGVMVVQEVPVSTG